MFIVLTRSWESSWYQCFEDIEAAKKSFEYGRRYHPNCWLIEGSVIQEKIYAENNEGEIPW